MNNYDIPWHQGRLCYSSCAEFCSRGHLLLLVLLYSFVQECDPLSTKGPVLQKEYESAKHVVERTCSYKVSKAASRDFRCSMVEDTDILLDNLHGSIQKLVETKPKFAQSAAICFLEQRKLRQGTNAQARISVRSLLPLCSMKSSED